MAKRLMAAGWLQFNGEDVSRPLFWLFERRAELAAQKKTVMRKHDGQVGNNPTNTNPETATD